ncbi:hypothetical protein [Paenibacillus thalictri]|uniref:Uncharacterized protein n=1 Tax=Paenibacillus thalictri TaxID=2527873 RepID=A0A4Q9DIK7_9BACL|nr:hypothetical protein [Paenibacillus thalictri]TBL73222.1 hypothetical protein EYB31_26425 [Paenibacillus thalictri]
MISDEQLDRYRLDGILLRVVRDASPENDLRGYVVAWDEESVVIRKRNRNMVKLKRSYRYQPYEQERSTDGLGI